MGELQKIIRLFDDLQQGDCWIGLNMKQVLGGIDPVTAVQKFQEGNNNIWQLVNHLIYWRKTVMIRLQGKNERPPGSDFYLPEDQGEISWQNTLQAFDTVYHELNNTMLAFDETKLDDLSPVKGQSYYQLLIGCLQHDCYHMGQIGFKKKISRQSYFF